MNGHEDLAASKYLVEAYIAAADAYENFSTSGDEKALRRATEITCDTLGRLSEDGEFWGAMIDAIDNPDESDEIGDLLASLLELRTMEEEMLVARGMSPERAANLLSDVVTAIEIRNEVPSGKTIENLRDRIFDLRDQVCHVRGEGSGGKALRIIRRGLKGLGGAAVVAVDIGAGLAVLPMVVSVAGGASAMIDAAIGD